MVAAEEAYVQIVDGLMDLIQTVPDRSDAVYAMLGHLRTVLDAGQSVVDSNRRSVESRRTNS